MPQSAKDKKMIVRTFQAAESAGVSTDMHSTVGKTTINMYRQFVVREKRTNEKEEKDVKRMQDQIINTLSMIPDDMPEDIKNAGITLQIDKMQKVLQNKKKADSMMEKLQALKDEIKDEKRQNQDEENGMEKDVQDVGEDEKM